jgi:hypothetical protein
VLERNVVSLVRSARASDLFSLISARDANGENTALTESVNSVANGTKSAKERNAETPRSNAHSRDSLFVPFQRRTALSLHTETLDHQENTVANGSTIVKERNAHQSRRHASGEDLSTRTQSASNAESSREKEEDKRNVVDPSLNAVIQFAKPSKELANLLDNFQRRNPSDTATSSKLEDSPRENTVVERLKLAMVMNAT